MKHLKICLFTCIVLMYSSCQIIDLSPEPTIDVVTSESTFGNYTFNISSDNAQAITLDFGDGNSEHVTPPNNVVTHQYNKDGAYTAKLVATNKKGEQTTLERVVKVTSTSGSRTIILGKKTDGFVYLSINNTNVMTFKSYYTTTVACGTNSDGAFTFVGKPGVYNLKATTLYGTSNWEGTFTIENNKCNTLMLQ